MRKHITTTVGYETINNVKISGELRIVDDEDHNKGDQTHPSSIADFLISCFSLETLRDVTLRLVSHLREIDDSEQDELP